MIILPALKPYTKSRPNRPLYDVAYSVPDEKHYSFWEKIHHFLYSLVLHKPINKLKESINPIHGYFGLRMHPETFEAQYYHLGVEIGMTPGTEIKPLARGILEYSGYGAVNGYYILLSHPHIKTEDGYVLHTMYCHLKKPLIKFSSYQKMLREISLGSHPLIKVDKDTVLGIAGTSGVVNDKKPTLYLQCDFRKFDHTPIVVDPMNFFSELKHTNISANINSKDHFEKML